MKRREEEFINSRQHIASINSSAAQVMQITTILLQDIMVKIFGMAANHQNVVWGTTERNEPAFGFSSSENDKDKLEKFMRTLQRVRLSPYDNVWALDLNNHAVMLKGANLCNDFIRGILTAYGGPRPQIEKIKPRGISSTEISDKDLKYIDNRAFLGEIDFQASFKKAINDSGESIYRHFTYRLEDLDKAVRAFEYDHDGVIGYSVDDVFRFQ